MIARRHLPLSITLVVGMSLLTTPVMAVLGDWLMQCALACPENFMTDGLPRLWDLRETIENGDNVECKWVELRELADSRYALREYPSVTAQCVHNRQTAKRESTQPPFSRPAPHSRAVELMSDVSGSTADAENYFPAVLAGGKDICFADVFNVAWNRYNDCNEAPKLQNADPEEYTATYTEIKCSVKLIEGEHMCQATKYASKSCR